MLTNKEITEKQAIYEDLLDLGCPDLLASLIALRCKEGTTLPKDGIAAEFAVARGLSKNAFMISTIIGKSVMWDETEEGNDFWSNLWAGVASVWYKDFNDSGAING